ncbi:MAG: hypothetical protein KKA10_13815 [Euryarchaeota archaeon]|nr:hypothetical protein [Euryarchaeota archaeon]MCG2737391.1 hypothetical protein [Candidatus Methanoperedenaceae archaeon]
MFEPLKTEIIDNAIARIGMEGEISIEVVLLNGEIIFADLSLITYGNYLHLIPENEQSDEVRRFLENFKPEDGWKIRDSLLLFFNSVDGKKHGASHVIEVNKKFISGLRSFSFAGDAFNLGIKNIPNPFATVIYNNNIKIATKYGFTVRNYFEMGLSEEAIPPEGIHFEKEEIIFVDWDFIQHIAGGINSIGVSIANLGGSYGKQKSLDAFVLEKLRNGTYEQIKNFFNAKETEYHFEGFFVVPPDIQNTNIEGERCLLFICSESSSFNVAGNWIPILVKERSLSYPMEFLSKISSGLKFYGELKQMPVSICDVTKSACILCRIIGFLT